MLIRITSIVLLAGSFSLYADEIIVPATPATTVTTTTTKTSAPNIAPVTTTPFSSAPAVAVPDQTPVAGGYNDVSVKDPEVQSAATFAVNQIQQGTLVRVDSAQMQVVAGKNYKLTLILAQRSGNYQYNVTVFVPLPSANQSMQVTTVQSGGLVDATGG